MAGTPAAGADPDIPAKEAPSRAPEEQIEALQLQLLQRVRANLRLPDRPFAALSADHDAGLRALRLLDFVRLDIPSSGVPRPDLVADLIANYSSSRGRSSVRGKQIEVSLDSFAKALRLPPYGAPAGSGTDKATRTSASKEFSKIYIGAPAEASAGMKRRLPSIFYEENVKRGPDYTTRILWELVKQEMEHLIESESTDCVSYYGAFLQRLIWVEGPELFQLPLEPLSEAVAPAAVCVQLPPDPSEAVAPLALLCVWKEQETNLLSTIQESQECFSESDIHRGAEASPKPIDMASKRTWSSAFDSADKGYLLTESHEDNSVPRKSAGGNRRSVSRALSFEVADVAVDVQALPPVFAATPSLGLHKKGRGRPCKVKTALFEPDQNLSPCKVQTALVEPDQNLSPCKVQIDLAEPQNRSPCKVQTALVEPQNCSPCKVQTALVDPKNRRVTRGSIKSNDFRPTPVVDQHASPKKKLGAKMMVKKQTPTPVVDQQARPKKKRGPKMMVKKQTPARPQGTMIKQMKRRK